MRVCVCAELAGGEKKTSTRMLAPPGHEPEPHVPPLAWTIAMLGSFGIILYRYDTVPYI